MERTGCSKGLTAVSVTTVLAFIFYVVLLRQEEDLADETSSLKTSRVRRNSLLPKACRPYILNGTALDISHGRYIHAPGRQASYDHTCFIMKPRYNCATNDSSKPKAYEWKFVLQSDPDDPATLCDIGDFVDKVGGPGSDLLKDKRVGLFGNSRLRQIFEAVACKYQHQLTEVILHAGPKLSEGLLEDGKAKIFTIEEYGDALPVDLNKGSLPTCYGNRTDHEPFYGIQLSNDTVFYEQCDDDVALMEYGGSFRMYYSFWPHLLKDPLEVFDQFIGLSDLNTLDYIAYSEFGPLLKARVPETAASWDDFDHLPHHLKRLQMRDIGRWFGADNPWITHVPDSHGCMDGPPTDEAAILLFSILFEIHTLKRK